MSLSADIKTIKSVAKEAEYWCSSFPSAVLNTNIFTFWHMDRDTDLRYTQPFLKQLFLHILFPFIPSISLQALVVMSLSSLAPLTRFHWVPWPWLGKVMRVSKKSSLKFLVAPWPKSTCNSSAQPAWRKLEFCPKIFELINVAEIVNFMTTLHNLYLADSWFMHQSYLTLGHSFLSLKQPSK